MNPLRILGGAAFLLLCACGPVDEGPAGALPSDRDLPRPGGTLVITNRSDVDTINDLVSDGSNHGRDIERFLFQQLVRERPDFQEGPPTFEPQLAERWEFSDDGKTLTFHLRAAEWSDGVPLTAEDVRWSWIAQTAPEVAWRQRNRKEGIQDVEVVDERTVRFHFSTAYPDQLDDANAGVILPRHAWGAKPFSEWRTAGSWFVDTIVSSGPFVLTSWEPSQEMVLERNPRYGRSGRPLLDRVIVRIVPEKTTQINQLLGGELDYVRVVPADQIERLEQSERTAVVSSAGRNFDYLCWNTRHPMLTSAEVRRALTLATDRQAIVDSIYGDYARVAVTSVPASTWAFDDSLEPWPYDSSAASRLLTTAGFADADGDGIVERAGEPLEIELLVQSGNRVHIDAATLLQAQLRRSGVSLVIRQVEFKTWLERLKNQDFEAAIGGWFIPTSLDMSFAFHSREIGSYNFGSYSNPEVDRLLDAAAATLATEPRTELLHQVQAMLHQEQPYTFLWEPLLIDGRSQRVRDSRPNALSSYYSIDDWWLDGPR